METTAITPLGKILDLLLDAICVVDAEGRYVFVSAAFERIFGYAPEEVIGRRMIELVHPEDREVTLRTAAAIMDGKPESNFQNATCARTARWCTSCGRHAGPKPTG